LSFNKWYYRKRNRFHTSDTYLGDRAQPDEGFKPSVPKQKVNEFALKAIAEEAIEMIMPADYRMIAENRTVQKTASQLGFNP